jgi:hypothetical protein
VGENAIASGAVAVSVITAANGAPIIAVSTSTSSTASNAVVAPSRSTVPVTCKAWPTRGSSAARPSLWSAARNPKFAPW